jgi:hypothetical protein
MLRQISRMGNARTERFEKTFYGLRGTVVELRFCALPLQPPLFTAYVLGMVEAQTTSARR